jgi:hypothetical protein
VTLEDRKDSRFTQIVRNMVSHKKSATNIVGHGYAEHVESGLKITTKGHAYLASKGKLSGDVFR